MTTQNEIFLAASAGRRVRAMRAPYASGTSASGASARPEIDSKRLFVTHQIAAAIATAADFAAMFVLVKVARFSPGFATLVSALVGAWLNFVISRRWVYQGRHSGALSSQIQRYEVVAPGSALLNVSLLEAAVLTVGASYGLLRIGVSA